MNPVPLPTASPGFNGRLESLRGVAAMMVALGHAFLVLAMTPFPGVLRLCNGHAAVRLFFVLSGYVLGLALERMNLQPMRGLVIFAMRRVLRIVPAFVCATILVAGALMVLPTVSAGAAASGWFKQFYREPLSFGLLRDNLLFASASLNCVTWTLGVEIVGSLALGAAHFLAGRWPKWAQVLLLAPMLAAAWRFPQGTFLPYLFMFWLGYLLRATGPALAAACGRRAWLSTLMVGAALVVFLRSHETRFELWAEPFGAATLLAGLMYGAPLRGYRLLDRPWVSFYGRISYSFYLLHFPVLYWISAAALASVPAAWLLRWPHLSALALGLVSVAVATPLAWLMYVGVEKPGIRLSKRIDEWIRRGAPRPTAPGPATAAGGAAGSLEPARADGHDLPAPLGSVLFINRVYPPAEGATGQLLSQLAPALVEEGWAVTVLTSRAGTACGPLARALVAGVKIEYEPALAWRPGCHWQRAVSLLALYPALWLRALLLERPDLIVVLTDPPLAVVLGAVLRWFTGARLVHWAQDLYPEVAEELGVLRKGSIAARLLGAASRAALRRCDLVIAVGECMRARLEARGLEPSRLRVVPNWSPHLRETEASDSGMAFRLEHGLGGRFVVMYAGNFGLAHDFDAILDAAEQLRSSRTSLVFVLIGDGPRRTRVEDAVRQRHLTNVRLLPRQSQERLVESLSAADLHLASLRPELCGLVVPSKVYGILGAGRPCVFLGPRESEVAIRIEQWGCGEVLASADGTALARCLAQWAADPQRLAAAASQCRAIGPRISAAAAARRFHEELLGVAQTKILPSLSERERRPAPTAVCDRLVAGG